MKRKKLLVLLLVLGLGAAGCLLLKPKPAPPPVVFNPTAPQLAQAETHLSQLGQDASGPVAGPRTLRLSETDLNMFLAGNRSARKLLTSKGVKAIQIVLVEPANVVIHAAVHLRGPVQNILISGSLTPDTKAGLRFTASHAQVGSLPLPAAIVTAEANSVAARMTRQLDRHFAINVQSVRVEKNELVIVGLPVTVSPQLKSPARH